MLIIAQFIEHTQFINGAVGRLLKHGDRVLKTVELGRIYFCFTLSFPLLPPPHTPKTHIFHSSKETGYN
jgi:hypothetical protein